MVLGARPGWDLRRPAPMPTTRRARAAHPERAGRPISSCRAMGLELATALRPQGVGQLVDGGYQALRSHPRLLLSSAALFLVPVTLLVAVLGRGGPTPGLISAGSPAAGLVGLAGYSLSTALMGLPLA